MRTEIGKFVCAASKRRRRATRLAEDQDSDSIQSVVVSHDPLEFVSITSRERTLADIFERPELTNDLEALWKQLPKMFMEPGTRLQMDRLLNYLQRMKNLTGISRVGHFLQMHRFELKVSRLDLDEIRKMGVSTSLS